MSSQTVAVYDRVAGEFAERHWQTRLLDRMETFTATLRPGAVVLDAGCGPGRDCAWLRELGHVPIGLDASIGMLHEARRRVRGGCFVRGDLRSLPLGDEAVDGLWMCASLLHLTRSQAHQALGEAARVCAEGAPMYVGVQYGDGEQTREDGRFFAYWGAQELADAVAAAGFTVKIATTTHANPVTWVAVHAVKGLP